MRIKNILVPVDFTNCSVNAVKVAVEMAYYWDANITLLHASQVPATYFAYGEPLVEYPEEQHEEDITLAFHQIEEEVPLLRIKPYKTKELKTSLIQAVEMEMADAEVDFIVMGTRSEHGFIEKVLGTNAGDILSSVNIPVLILPENRREIEIHKIGVALDARGFSDTEKVDTIFKIARNEAASLHVFYVGDRDRRIDFNHSYFKKFFEDRYQDNDIYFENVIENDLIEGIKKHADDHDLDLLVVFPRQHSFLEKIKKGSVSKKLLVDLEIPLLAIPD